MNAKQSCDLAKFIMYPRVQREATIITSRMICSMIFNEPCRESIHSNSDAITNESNVRTRCSGGSLSIYYGVLSKDMQKRFLGFVSQPFFRKD